MTLVKAIVAMILALSALTTTFSFSFHSSDVQAIPKCFPCKE